ncbi:MAG TPA: quinone-dependent dihydroorotate dehydrogenase [Gammaproteobacteria bacterium]|nr:quinone-dependent dihydroorotate dehydrogenase [Gammaproteobacteria bacterium]
MNKTLKKLLFLLDPEQAHDVALHSLNLAYRLRLTTLIAKTAAPYPCTVMGMTFPNSIGLAAGLDKNADYVDALASLGFGFIEVGTVTPQPQAGNPRPRLFRLAKQEAIINRMGFNNKGVAHVAQQLARVRYRGILGINIGKNKDTPLERAVDDYLFCFQQLWPYASYITINISSPNTAGLRNLQQSELLRELLITLKNARQAVYEQQQKYVPLVVKISPDMTEEEAHGLAAILLEQHIDGVIATNTTTTREGVAEEQIAQESGGLSGKPLQARSTRTIQWLAGQLQGRIPIIGCGGIIDAASAKEKRDAGASLLQIYTGLIYRGPGLVRELVDSLVDSSVAV